MTTTEPNLQSAPPSADEGKKNVQIIYILYLASFVTGGLTSIIGLVMSYVAKDSSPEVLKSHHIFLIHTFWIGMLYAVIGWVLTFVLIGILVLLFVTVWWIVRCVQGMNYLSKGQAIPNPRSWLFA